MKNEKFIKKWEKDRQKGKKRYLLSAGVRLGVAMLLGSIIGRVIKGNFFYHLVEFYIYMHLSSFVGGFIGGVIGANLRWDWNEEKYNKLTTSIN